MQAAARTTMKPTRWAYKERSKPKALNSKDNRKLKREEQREKALAEALRGESELPEETLERCKKLTVTKKDGTVVPVDPRKIMDRIVKARNPLLGNHPNMRHAPALTRVNPVKLAQKLVLSLPDNIKTSELDLLLAKTASWDSTHYEYSFLGARIYISMVEKGISEQFIEVVRDAQQGQINVLDPLPLVADWYTEVCERFQTEFQEMLVFERDYFIRDRRPLATFNLSNYQTLEKCFLKRGTRILERPQHFYLREAIGIHRFMFEYLKDRGWPQLGCSMLLDWIKQTYDELSRMGYTHASPTMFNSGTERLPYMSCYLNYIPDDLKRIYDALGSAAMEAKGAGGIAMAAQLVRPKGSYIRKTNGISSGLEKVLHTFDVSASYVNQAGNKRPGSIAVYTTMEHHEADLVMSLRQNADRTKEESRVRSLFPAMFVSDSAMSRMITGRPIYQFSESEYPGLNEVFGTEFEELYNKYRKQGKARLAMVRKQKAQGLLPDGADIEGFSGYKKVRSADLFSKMCGMFEDSGLPYVVYKDTCNLKNNMCDRWAGFGKLDRSPGYDLLNNIVLSSNLCTEIIQVPDTCCNLASIDLWTCVKKDPKGKPYYDFVALFEITRMAVRNLDSVIDSTTYMTRETEDSNKRFRPMSVGVQGLANAFVAMGFAYDSDEAQRLNAKIFETMYYAALTESCQGAKERGTYPAYQGSPASKGVLQQDLFDMHYDYMTRLLEKVEQDCLKRMQTLPKKIANREVLVKLLLETRAQVDLAAIKSPPSGPSDTRSESLDKSLSLQEVLRKLVLDCPEVDENEIYLLARGKKAPRADLWIEAFQNPLVSRASGDRDRARRISLALDRLGTMVMSSARDTETDLLDLESNLTCFREAKARRDSRPKPGKPSGLWDWKALRRDITEHGLRNSLLVGHMPTVSTSAVTDRVECFEPFRSTVFAKSTNNGTYVQVVRELIDILEERGLWNEQMNADIRAAKGFLSRVPGMPEDIVRLFRTAFEIPMSTQFDMAWDRSPYVDQSMSLNWHVFQEKDHLSGDAFRILYAWMIGLKTGKYYKRISLEGEAFNPTAYATLAASTGTLTLSKPEEEEPEDPEPESFICKMEPGCFKCSG